MYRGVTPSPQVDRIRYRESVMSSHAAPLIALGLGLLALSACAEGRPARRELAGALATSVRVTPVCDGDALRPSTAAPAEGIWRDGGPSGGRVAVMVGPAREAAGDLRLTRRIEAVEVGNGGDTLRTREDATVSLELLPPLPGEGVGDSPTATGTPGDQPAAAFVLGSAIVVAAYEPCATSQRAPRLRYLRRDARGRPVIDVMLQRASDR
jgi:hypothetical protein